MELIKYENEKLDITSNVINELKNYKALKVKMDMLDKQLREEFLEAFEKYGIMSWHSEDGSIEVNYKKPYTRTSIDSTRLKKELPDIAEEYSKTTNVKSSVEINIEV